MIRRLALLASVALLLAACGGGHTIAARKASSLVLQPADVGKGFASFYDSAVAHIDTAGTPRANPERFGHEAGWIARYHRGGSAETRGPLVVESRADVFSSSSGAKQDLVAYRATFAAAAGADRRALPAPQLGDAAVAEAFVQPGAKPIHFYAIAWRDRNATASVLVEGFSVRLADALALARRQERRLGSA